MARKYLTLYAATVKSAIVTVALWRLQLTARTDEFYRSSSWRALNGPPHLMEGGVFLTASFSGPAGLARQLPLSVTDLAFLSLGEVPPI